MSRAPSPPPPTQTTRNHCSVRSLSVNTQSLQNFAVPVNLLIEASITDTTDSAAAFVDVNLPENQRYHAMKSRTALERRACINISPVRTCEPVSETQLHKKCSRNRSNYEIILRHDARRSRADPAANDYYIVFTSLFTGSGAAIPLNGADRLIQSDKWSLGRLAANRASADASRGLHRFQRAAARPDLRGDLQIGGYCAPARKSNCPVNQNVCQRSLNVRQIPEIGPRTCAAFLLLLLLPLLAILPRPSFRFRRSSPH